MHFWCWFRKSFYFFSSTSRFWDISVVIIWLMTSQNSILKWQNNVNEGRSGSSVGKSPEPTHQWLGPEPFGGAFSAPPDPLAHQTGYHTNLPRLSKSPRTATGRNKCLILECLILRKLILKIPNYLSRSCVVGDERQCVGYDGNCWHLNEIAPLF